jgi:transcriptional regulator with XRE-family HTH domain
MAHALREFIRTQMDERQIDQATFTRTSGLTRSHVSKLLRDDRDRLPQLPRRETLAGIAKAFSVSPQVVLAVAVEALGLGYEAADFVNELSQATNEELARELERRLLRAPHHGSVPSPFGAADEDTTAEEFRAQQDAATFEALVATISTEVEAGHVDLKNVQSLWIQPIQGDLYELGRGMLEAMKSGAVYVSPDAAVEGARQKFGLVVVHHADDVGHLVGTELTEDGLHLDTAASEPRDE